MISLLIPAVLRHRLKYFRQFIQMIWKQQFHLILLEEKILAIWMEFHI